MSVLEFWRTHGPEFASLFRQHVLLVAVSTFSAISRMSGICTLDPQLYCMERVVSSQNG